MTTEQEQVELPQPIHEGYSQAPSCQEDEPCWDCTTMGNLICGPTTTITTQPPIPSTQLPNTGSSITPVGISAGLCVVLGWAAIRASRRNPNINKR